MGVKDRWEYYYHKGAERVECAPHSLNLEPTNVCNLKCPGCSLSKERERGFMDLDLFSSLVEQAAKIGVEEIRLFLAGEPFLHKQIAQMVEQCTRRGLRSIIHTNASKMTPEQSKSVIEAGLTTISLSIDGDDKETYEAARLGAKFEKTIENARALLTQKQDLGAKQPHVIIQTLVDVGRPLDPPPGLVEQFQGVPVGHYKVLHPHNWRGEADVGDERRESARPNPCMFLWHELSVGWDGRVVGCCADLNGFFFRGDLKTDPILKIWNNRKSRELRRLHARRTPEDHSLCKGCSVPYQNQKVTPLGKVRKQELKKTVKWILGR